MNGLLAAEMAVWAPEDMPAPAASAPQPEQALAALDRQGLRLSGTVIAIALLSTAAAAVTSLY